MKKFELDGKYFVNISQSNSKSNSSVLHPTAARGSEKQCLRVRRILIAIFLHSTISQCEKKNFTQVNSMVSYSLTKLVDNYHILLEFSLVVMVA